MMGERQVQQDALFYEFSLERHVPEKHLLRAIDRFVDLSGVRGHLAPFYSETGRPSIDPELLIRMLIVGYCFGIRSERRLCEEVHLNLAYRWFCRLGLDGDVPDHSTFSKTRHGRFRESDLLRELFETVVRRCMAEGLVGGEGFAVVASAGSRRPTSSVQRLTGRSPNISLLWTMPRSGPLPRSSRNSSRPSIPPRAGPPLGVDLPSMLIAPIISSTCSMQLLSTWSPPPPCARPRWLPPRP